MSTPGGINSVLLATLAGGGGDYAIERSVRFNSDDSAYLSRTPASAGNRKTWTWAGWVKRSNLTDAYNTLFSATAASYFAFQADGTLLWYEGSTLITAQLFRDASAWYHIVLAYDSTQATESDRIKVYVNGAQVTSFSAANYPAQNTDSTVNSTGEHNIGKITTLAGTYLSAYLADVHFIDGQALDPTSFGQFDANGIWQPIAYSGSYGTNGFHLFFDDNSTAAALGTDTSGNGNDWTVNNLSVTAGSGNDSLVDVPTNGTEEDTGVGGEVRGNYCTWNPLQKNANVTLLNGNLNYTTTGAYPTAAIGTIGVSSGKWYYETVCTASPFTPPVLYVGLVNTATFNLPSSGLLTVTGVYAYSLREGGTVSNGSFSASGWSTAAVNDVIGVAFDIDAGTISFYKNNSLLGTLSGLSGTFAPFIAADTSSSPTSAYTNFGQRPFAYTAPSGFKALCTVNLPAPTIEDPSTVMDVALYTGTAASKTITDLNFSPDFAWIKNRSNASGYNHGLFDIVRGANKVLSSSTTGSEVTYTQQLTSFNSDGFTLGDNSDSGNYVNLSGDSYVAWTWDAGSSTVTNNDGDISSQVRANTSAGFSIVTWTGTGPTASVGHGLGVAPQFWIQKSRSSAAVWNIYHSSLGPDKYLQFNTASAGTASGIWGTGPTSTVMNLGGGFGVNNSSVTYVAYCFAPVAGYSAFGSYTGNGDPTGDGPFVYTGFRPRWVMVKETTTGGVTSNWMIKDSSRPAYNATSGNLYPNLSLAEDNLSSGDVDLTSNGFKIRGNYGGLNASGSVIIYAAFAENPFALNARAR